MNSPRVVIAGFHHETNTFAPCKTPYEEFVKDDGWPGLVQGEAVIAALEPMNLGMGGFIHAALEQNWQLAPLLWCNAEPFAHVTEDAYERIVGLIIEGVRRELDLSAAGKSQRFDAIYLCMHGAMVAEHTEDGEGELLKRLRELVGADMPIVMSLDLHANLTPEMFALADGIAVFRTYPHIDMADTGRRAFNLLKPMLETGEKPAKAYRQGPFLLPLTSQYTGAMPAEAIYTEVESVQFAGLLSVDFACGFPPADIPHCGPSALAYASTHSAAKMAIDSVMQVVESLEAEFAERLMDADTAVQRALQIQASGASGPVVIADVQDNPGAGGSGDTTGLLESLHRHKVRNALFSTLWDAQSAQIASAAGVGEVVSLSLGGRNGPPGVSPFAGDFEVLALTNGRFQGVGPMMKGTEYKLGPMALLRLIDPASKQQDDGNLRIIVTSERAQCLDRGFILSMGLEPAEFDLIALKSSVHFRNDFEQVASEILLAACPGANLCDLAAIPYTRLREGIRLPQDYS